MSAQTGLKRIRNIIAVASGKGGVGKSTTTTNLAFALRHLGYDVGLIDADIYGPSIPAMLGVKPERAKLSEDKSLVPVFAHGIQFVSMAVLLGSDGPVVWRAPMAMKIINEFIKNVEWGNLDYLLIDLPPGTGDVQLTLAQQASLSGAVIVTTPQNIAVGIAKKGLKMFQQVNVPILGVVENMSGFECSNCGELTHIFSSNGGREMAETLKVPFLGTLPLDQAIMEGSDKGVPLLAENTSSPSSKAYLKLALNIQQQLGIVKGDMLEPKEVEFEPKGGIKIDWPDGHKGFHRPLTLRTDCKCSMCVDENSGEKMIWAENVSLDIKVKGFSPVGRYALGLEFSDGHDTGIFPYRRLREACECYDCTRRNNVVSSLSF